MFLIILMMKLPPSQVFLNAPMPRISWSTYL
jgi:hypothetical protein